MIILSEVITYISGGPYQVVSADIRRKIYGEFRLQVKP